jgi:hypothetical protein
MNRISAALALCFAAQLAADIIEVRRDADVYVEPNRRSERITRITLTDRTGPYTVPLAQAASENGYYKIRLPGEPIEGWVYKTFIRRFRDQHPSFRAYDRSLYRHWVDEDRDCQDTRQEVLVRDAKRRTVEFQDAQECTVSGATWLDPYSGESFANPKDLDVDHFVPLKNAHLSGAWAWSPERRREYANFLSDPVHLLAVKASENRRKGDKGPDKYLPPRAEFQCEYVRTWVKIKSDWDLTMTDTESATVQRILAKCR